MFIMLRKWNIKNDQANLKSYLIGFKYNREKYCSHQINNIYNKVLLRYEGILVDFGYKVNNPYKYLEPYSQFNKLYEIIL